MKKYVIAIFSHHDGDNRIFYVQGNSDVEALKKALISHCPEEHRDTLTLESINNLKGTYSEIQEEILKWDLSVSNAFNCALVNAPIPTVKQQI